MKQILLLPYMVDLRFYLSLIIKGLIIVNKFNPDVAQVFYLNF